MSEHTSNSERTRRAISPSLLSASLPLTLFVAVPLASLPRRIPVVMQLESLRALAATQSIPPANAFTVALGLFVAWLPARHTLRGRVPGDALIEPQVVPACHRAQVRG